jgi:hypothetical protein
VAVAKLYLQANKLMKASRSRCRATAFVREYVTRLKLILSPPSIMIRWLSLGEARMKIIVILAFVAPATSSLVDPSLISLSTNTIIQSLVRFELDTSSFYATCAGQSASIPHKLLRL